MFKPNLSVKEGLDHLAERLDPIITARLEPSLGGLPWTSILQILDERKGKSRTYQYWTHDLQAQLRILTERLGDLGYPFDDHDRAVTTMGNELRIVRKQTAHMYAFSVEEAFRANDYCVRLLEYFGDVAGAEPARRIRNEALSAFAADEGVSMKSALSAIPALSVEDALTDPRPNDEPELVSPDPEDLDREPSVIGNQRIVFEPWNVVPAGGLEVLDDLPKKAAKEKVRAVALEIASFEGPIHLDRLVQKTAQSFGLKRLWSGREKKLKYQIKQIGLFVDTHKFVWPEDVEPETWREFRPSDSNADRPFEHISPVEIANAIVSVRARHPEFTQDELESRVLQAFGRKRRTKQVLAHLRRAFEHLESA